MANKIDAAVWTNCLMRMRPRELWRQLEKERKPIFVVDLRSQAAYANGHVPGAICYEQINKQLLDSEEVFGTGPIVIYGQEGFASEYDCFRPNKAAIVYELKDGWLGWMREGLPISPPLSQTLEPGQFMDGMDRRLISRQPEDR